MRGPQSIPSRPTLRRLWFAAGSIVSHEIQWYVGLFFALLGWAVYLSNPLSLVFLLVYVMYITRFQIKPEERIFLGLFGKPYAITCEESAGGYET